MVLRLSLVLSLFAAVFAATLPAQTTVTVSVKRPKAKPDRPFAGDRPAVDVAILLDTSNSMDGLISQAKTQLWTIVQEFARAKQAGQTPQLRVALFEYGNTNLPAAEGYIRQVVPLTNDLDELSAALFALRTQGGDEYCGQTIREAIDRLDWSGEPNAYQAIFIAGNEPFSQGSVDFREACRRAIEAGIVVNTIHCGDYEAGIRGHWKEGADLAEGDYFNIDQDRKEVHISCPQDEVILRLNTELNRTYLWFGKSGDRARWQSNQLAQDANASEASPISGVSRVAAKASAAYDNRQRDLVDAYREDRLILTQVADGELPDQMQAMSEEQRQQYLTETAEKRAELQAKIAELNREREQFLAKERQKLSDQEGPAMLGDVMVKAIRAQLSDAGFE